MARKACRSGRPVAIAPGSVAGRRDSEFQPAAGQVRQFQATLGGLLKGSQEGIGQRLGIASGAHQGHNLARYARTAANRRGLENPYIIGGYRIQGNSQAFDLFTVT